MNGNRKLVALLVPALIVVGGAAMVFTGHLPADQWIELGKWCVGGVGAFFAANSVEHLRK